MCGLAGMFGELVSQDRVFFRTLMTLNQLRGRHSTGLAITGNEYPTQVWKEVGGFERLALENAGDWDVDLLFPVLDVEEEEVTYTSKDGKKNKSKVSREVMPTLLLGHGRHATLGTINRENAHPFMLENVTGVHNGTMYDYWLSRLKTYTGKTTDSEAVFRVIDGITDTDELNEFLSSLSGQFAFIWFDERDSTLHLYRNNDRTLYFMERGDSAIAWASEKWMLEKARDYSATRNGKVKWSEARAVTPYKHIVCKYEGGKVKSVSVTDVPFVYSTDSRWYNAPAYTKPVSYVSSTYNPYNWWNPVGKVSLEEPEYVHGFNKTLLTHAGYERIAASGCCMCTQPLPGVAEATKDNVFWVDAVSPMCKECNDKLSAEGERYAI